MEAIRREIEQSRFRIRQAVIMTVILIFGLPFVQDPFAIAQEYITDYDITFAVESELHADDRVPAHLVDVETDNGVVTLSGMVPNMLSDMYATRVTENVKGVRSVVNNVTVRTPERADAAIRQDVKHCLEIDPLADIRKIDVNVNDGTVMLSGTVHSWAEKQLAKRIAMGVRGVEEIEDNIEITYEADRSDSEIREDVMARLEADVWLEDANIEVAVNDGKVLLSGEVESAAQKRYATEDAWVIGTMNVVNENLSVAAGAGMDQDREMKNPDISDTKIVEAIDAGLRADPRVNENRVDVYSSDRVVTLKGRVENLRARSAAEQIAKNTYGVVFVQNRIKVRPPKLVEDNALENNVEQTLAFDSYLEGDEIVADAVNGRVILRGFVDTKYEKKRAEALAERLSGVIEVANFIDYEHSQPEKEDWQLRRDVENEFFWSPYVEIDDVKIDVSDGVVTLTGTADTMLERRMAVNNAFDAGAKDVVNLLTLKEPIAEPTEISG